MTGASARHSVAVDGDCGNVRSMSSPQDYMGDRELDAAVLEAQRLAFVVHEYDRDEVCDVVRHIEETRQTRAVLVALAAMVDIDRPISELLGWVLDAARRRPWQREGGYPPCDPADDRSPAGCVSEHGTPARHTSGCRGEGCRLARSDYDRWRYRARGRRDAHHNPARSLSQHPEPAEC